MLHGLMSSSLSFSAVFGSDSGSPLRAGSCLSDTEDDRSDSLRRCKHSGLRHPATPPSLDSAMDSWDGSALDGGYGSQGEGGALMERMVLSGLWGQL